MDTCPQGAHGRCRSGRRKLTQPMSLSTQIQIGSVEIGAFQLAVMNLEGHDAGPICNAVDAQLVALGIPDNFEAVVEQDTFVQNVVGRLEGGLSFEYEYCGTTTVLPLLFMVSPMHALHPASPRADRCH